jgi:hypothetical protein
MRKSLLVLSLFAASSIAFAADDTPKTEIKGNTNINALGVNTNAVAIGKGNTATNDIGTIGGK